MTEYKHDAAQEQAKQVTDLSTDGPDISLAEQTLKVQIDRYVDILPQHKDLKCPGRIAITFCSTENWGNRADNISAMLNHVATKPIQNGLNIMIRPSAGFEFDDPHIVIREVAKNKYQAIVIGDSTLFDFHEQRLALHKIRTMIFLHENGLGDLNIIREIMSDFRGSSKVDSYEAGAQLIERENYTKYLGKDTSTLNPREADVTEQILSTLLEALPEGMKGARAIKQSIRNYELDKQLQEALSEFSSPGDRVLSILKGPKQKLGPLTDRDMIEFITVVKETLLDLAKART